MCERRMNALIFLSQSSRGWPGAVGVCKGIRQRAIAGLNFGPQFNVNLAKLLRKFSIIYMTFPVVALFLITLSNPGAPGPDLCPLVAELNRIIADSTAYVPAPCPVIGFAVLPEGGAMRSQAGAYFPETGRIELAPDLDLTGAYGQSYLLHELIHAAQFANGADATAECPARLEAEAYSLQSDFLQINGLPREAVLVRLLADHLGRCGPADY